MNDQAELLSFLAKLGFEGPALAADIGDLLERFPPSGTIQHLIRYGEEQVRFALNLEHDRQFNAYRLASYKATYRKAVSIVRDSYNGVDIRGLEALMGSIDWQRWFAAREQLPGAATAERVDHQLNQLANGGSEGFELRDLLRYKYFPPEALDDRVRRKMTTEYEQTRSFYAASNGITNASLAYHLLNGNLERLQNSLAATGLEEWVPINLHDLLCQHLSGNPAEFRVECVKSTEEGIMSFSIPVQLINGRYEPGANAVAFEPAETINHRKIAHVDTRALEQQMAAIDWDSPDLYELGQDNVRLSAAVERIDRMLSFLEQTTSGKLIASQLKRKYWSAAPFFETLVPPKDTQPVKIITAFPLDFLVPNIYNLMCGRAVIARSLRTVPDGFCEWLRMTDIRGTSPQFTTIKDGLSRTDIDHLVTTLCVREPESEIVNALLQGDRVNANARTLDGYRNLRLEAVPEQRDLKVLDENGANIPMNFRLQTKSELQKTRGNIMVAGKGKRQGNKHGQGI